MLHAVTASMLHIVKALYIYICLVCTYALCIFWNVKYIPEKKPRKNTS